MTDTDLNLDELGPVDWIVVEFPGSKFNGEIAPKIQDLVDRGIIRILDIVFIRKDDDGVLDALEIEDLDDGEVGVFRAYEKAVAHLLTEDDVTALSASMDRGTTAAVLVWENVWAVPMALAIRRAGGQLVANGRIPIQALLASVEDETDESASSEAVDEQEGV
jgi:hypothetical protein